MLPGEWSDNVVSSIDLGISLLRGGNTSVQKVGTCRCISSQLYSVLYRWLASRQVQNQYFHLLILHCGLSRGVGFSSEWSLMKGPLNLISIWWSHCNHHHLLIIIEYIYILSISYRSYILLKVWTLTDNIDLFYLAVVWCHWLIWFIVIHLSPVIYKRIQTKLWSENWSDIDYLSLWLLVITTETKCGALSCYVQWCYKQSCTFV